VVTLGVPRSIILFPAATVGFIKMIVTHGRLEYLSDAAPFCGASIPLILAAWGSFAHRKRVSKPVAIGLTLTSIGEILYLEWPSE
jgi:hypothetical protein